MSECRTEQLGKVCFTDAAGASRSLFVTHVYDTDSVLISTVFHDAKGVPVDTAGGSVRPGPCTSQIVYGDPVCVRLPDNSTIEAVPYGSWNGVTLSPLGFVSADTLTPLVGSTIANPCDCPCVNCAELPQIDIVKTLVSGNASGAVVGTVLTYNLHVCNTGNVNLVNISISDPGAVPAITTFPALAVGACVDVPVTLTVTQAMITAGQIVNSATATGETPTGGSTASDSITTVIAAENPAVTLDKRLAAGTVVPLYVGQVVTYEFVIVNTGNVVLNPLQLVDATLGVNQNVGPLAIGATNVVAIPVTITTGMVASNAVTNTASVTGTAPSGNTVNAADTVITPVQAPAMTLVKSITSYTGNPNIALAGDIINYQFLICNTGNVPLTNVTVTDPGATTTGGPIATLAVGACSSAITGTHVVAAANITAGGFTNTATANGTSPTGTPVATNPSSTTQPLVAPQPALSLVKSITSYSGNPNAAVVGDIITYGFTVCNTGNVALTGVTINDPGSTLVGGPLNIGVGGCNSTHFTATYAVTAADIAAGEVLNTATTNGVSPSGAAVTSPPSNTTNQPLCSIQQFLNGNFTQTNPTTWTSSDGVIVQWTTTAPASVTGTAASVIDPADNPAWFTTVAPGQTALAPVFNWGGTTPTVIDPVPANAGTGTLRITYPAGSTDHQFHIDRMGGFGSVGTNGFTNSLELTAQNGMTVTELSGTGDFDTTGTTIRKTPNVPSAVNVPATSGSTATNGTAAGSVALNGLTGGNVALFNWRGVGVQGAAADGFRMAFSYRRAVCP